MTGNFLGIVENVTFAADVSKKKPKFGVLADLSKTELLVYQKRNFCVYMDGTEKIIARAEYRGCAFRERALREVCLYMMCNVTQ